MGNLFYKKYNICNTNEDTSGINSIICSDFKEIFPYLVPNLLSYKYTITDLDQLYEDIELSKNRARLSHEITIIRVLDKVCNRIKEKIESDKDNESTDNTYTNSAYNDSAYNDSAYNDSAYNDSAYNDSKVTYRTIYHNKDEIETFDVNGAIYNEDFRILPHLVLDLWRYKYNASNIDKLEEDIQLSKEKANTHLEKKISDIDKVHDLIKSSIEV